MEPFVISRRTWMHGVLSLAAVSVAGASAYLAWSAGPELLWAVAGLLGLLGLVHLIAARDALTPLLVADEQGVRIRTRREWHGIVWADIGDIRIEPREGLVRDPHVKIVSIDGQRIYTAPVGPSTNSTVRKAQVQLSARRKEPAF